MTKTILDKLGLKYKTDFNKIDRPLSIRVPLKTHDKYKSLSGFERKEIQYKFNVWLRKQLNKKEV